MGIIWDSLYKLIEVHQDAYSSRALGFSNFNYCPLGWTATELPLNRQLKHNMGDKGLMNNQRRVLYMPPALRTHWAMTKHLKPFLFHRLSGPVPPTERTRDRESQ